MYKIFKLVILIIGLNSALSATNSSWVPIGMGDITTFVPYGQINTLKTLKNVYKPNDLVSVKVDAALSGDEDWVGVYHKGAVSNWANVVAWNWIPHNGTIALSDGDGNMPVGAYEARLFFHNNYNVKASYPFIVSNDTFKTMKPKYSPNETVSVMVNVPLSGDKDWVGIFPKGSSNAWGNVIKWAWVKKKGEVILNKTENVSNSNMPAGEYEVRLFFHNEYGTDATVRAKYGFSVGGNGYVYGSPGQYINSVDVDDTDADYIVYRPKNHTKDAPVMLFFGMSFATGNYDNNNHKTSLRSEGLMKYLASLGCYVIGNKNVTPAWRDATKWPSYSRALEEARNAGADTGKLGIIGHSAGGMASYWAMRKYKADGYGHKKSFIIDLHGYDAVSMSRDDLSNLKNVDSLMIAYGGLNGDASETTHTGNMTDFSEDPRVLLTLSHLLPNTVKKGFIVLKTKDHMYSYGEWEEEIINGNHYDAIKNKGDLLEPIDAMIKYEFFNANGQYNNAKAILFDKYDETVQKVYDATMDFIGNKGDWKNDYAYKCVDKETGKPLNNTIDYCNDHGLH